MFLIFDVEAAGKPRSWKAPATDTFAWPRMVEIAWQIYDKQVKVINSGHYLIQPEGFEIPYEMEKIHGVSTEKAKEEGVPLKQALEEFAKAIDQSKFAIAHNMNHHENVVGAEFYRTSLNHRLSSTETICLMQEATYFCKLRGTQGRYKWPTLQELYARVFGSRFLRENGAKDDVQATANCFFTLVHRKEIDPF